MFPLFLMLRLGAAPTADLLSFEWNAPPACPPVESLRARLSHLSGRAVATATEQPLGWKLEVRVNESVRELTTGTCEEAADAAVLIIQLGLSPSPAAPVPPPAPPPPAVIAPVSEQSPWAIHASLIGGAGFAAWPQPMPRFGASGSLQHRQLAATLEVTTALPARFSGGPTAASAATVQVLIAVQLGGCWLFGSGAATFGPCLDAEVGWLQARGENVSSPRLASIAIWSVGPGARATLALTSWLELLASVAVRFGPRPSIFFEGSPPVVQAGPVSVDLLAGIGVRF